MTIAADWRELAPNLAKRPVQLDLLARSSDSSERSAFHDTIVPADAYRKSDCASRPISRWRMNPFPKQTRVGVPVSTA